MLIFGTSNLKKVGMEFIQVIVVIAIIGYAVYNNMQKEKARSRKRNPARPVADDPVAEPLPATGGRPDAPPPYRAQADTPRPRKAAKPAPSAKPPRQTPTRPAASTGSESIRLRTAEEARRAFIYSEIFNRKY